MSGRHATVLLGVAALFFLAVQAAFAGVVQPVVGQDVICKVGDKDDLPSIAHRYGLAMEHIAFANGMPIDEFVPDVDAGTALLIPGRHILPANPPRDGLVLNIPERGLYLFRRGQFVRFYPVAVGRPHFETPLGNFTIVEKVKNPTWTPPKWAKLGETVIPAGPNNPLGDRWLGLSGGGVGIHGTVSPDAIGMNISHGCIRMYPDLVRELYDQVEVGMPVRIEYEPVKLGYDKASGNVFMAVYPDVYGRVPPVQRALSLVHQGGLAHPVPDRRVEELATLQSGLVLSLESDPFFVTVDARRLPLLSGPVREGSALWVPLQVVKAAGVATTVQEDDVQLQLGERTVRLHMEDGQPPTSLPAVQKDPDGTYETVGYRWHRQTLIPVTSVLKRLGLACEWQAQDATLAIHTETDLPGDAPPTVGPPAPEPAPDETPTP